jgi:dsRNA-specific ribonuclease
MKASPPSKHHDLLDAAANVGILESRLGYTFKDRMTCLKALKISPYPLYYDGTVYNIGGNRRLALLGDRVLSLVLCEIWFQTEHSNREYSLMTSETVSRAALAITGRAIGLHQSMWVPDDNSRGPPRKWNHQIAEALEAVLGAVFVDSNYDMKAVKAIISKLKLDDHQFLKTRAGVDIAQTKTLLPQSVDEQAVISASPISTTVDDVQDSTPTEEQKPNKLNQRDEQGLTVLRTLAKSTVNDVQDSTTAEERDKQELTVLKTLAKSTCADTAEAAIKALDFCNERAKAGGSIHPQLVYTAYRRKILQRNKKLVRMMVRKTEDNNPASQGKQQEARKTTATKAHKVFDKRDREIVEDSPKALTNLRKPENDKPKANTEPCKVQIQQIPTPAIERAQGTQIVAKTKTGTKADSNKDAQIPNPDPKSGCSSGTRDRNEDLARPTKNVARNTQIDYARKDFAAIQERLIASTIDTVYISTWVKVRKSCTIDSRQDVVDHLMQLNRTGISRSLFVFIITSAQSGGIRLFSTTWDDLVRRTFEQLDKMVDGNEMGPFQAKNKIAGMLKAQAILPGLQGSSSL